MEIKFKAELWEWQGQGAWCFVSLPKEYYDEIRVISSSPKRGFGSVKVEASIGKTLWKTSLFPDTKSGTYILPVKKAIRKAEELNIGSVVHMKVRLIDFSSDRSGERVSFWGTGHCIYGQETKNLYPILDWARTILDYVIKPRPVLMSDLPVTNNTSAEV